jgi:outer membrane protein
MQYKKYASKSFTIYLCSFWFAFSTATIPLQVSAYDITDAINAAIKNNTHLKGSAIDLEKTKLDRFRAASSFLPNIGVQSSSSKQYSNSSDFKNPSRQDVLSIQEEVFSGGKGIYDLKASAFANEVATIQYQNEIDRTILQVVQSYEQVIAARNLYKTAIQNEEAMRNILKQSEVKLSIGAITRTDMLEAKARLAGAVSAKEKALADMKNTEQSFIYVIGEQAPKDMIDIDIKTLEIPKHFETFLNDVGRQNPSIDMSEKVIRTKSFMVKSAKANLLPTITAKASVQNQSAFQPPFYQQRQSSSGETYQLIFSLPIFRQGIDYVNIKQSLLDEEAARNNRDDTALKIQKEAAEAWNRYIQGKFAVEADTDSVEYYGEFVRGMEEEFYVGTKTLTDLLQAQVNYERAKINLIQDKASLVISALNLKYLLGEMNSVDFSKLDVKDKIEKKNIKKQDEKPIELKKTNNTERIATISDENIT